MSFVIAAPDLVAMATEDLAGIGASLTAANAAAASRQAGCWPLLAMRCRRPSRRCFPATVSSIRR